MQQLAALAITLLLLLPALPFAGPRDEPSCPAQVTVAESSACLLVRAALSGRREAVAIGGRQSDGSAAPALAMAQATAGRARVVAPPEDGETQTPPLSPEQAAKKTQHMLRRLQESVTVAEGLMLMGTVAFVMSLFYLVHFPDPDIRLATWNALSATISVFCALLLFHALKHVMVTFLDESRGEDQAAPTSRALVITFVRLLVMYTGLNALLVQLRGSGDFMQAIGLLGYHLVAFASIDAFGSLQQAEPFRSSLSSCLAAAGLAAVSLSAGVLGSDSLRARGQSAADDEEWEGFKECCSEGDEEVTSLTLGFLLCHAVRFAIVGHLAPLHGAPKGKQQEDVNKLLVSVVVCALIVAGVSLCHRYMRRMGSFSSNAVRWMRIAESVSAMAMAWCLLSWGQWQFWSSTSGQGVGEGDRMTARMLLALISSIIAFVAIFVLDFLSDRNILETRSLVNAFVVVMALAWEAAFDVAVQGVSELFEGTQFIVVEVALSVFLSAMVLPAWALYIFPHTSKQSQDNGDSAAMASDAFTFCTASAQG